MSMVLFNNVKILDVFVLVICLICMNWFVCLVLRKLKMIVIFNWVIFLLCGVRLFRVVIVRK